MKCKFVTAGNCLHFYFLCFTKKFVISNLFRISTLDAIATNIGMRKMMNFTHLLREGKFFPVEVSLFRCCRNELVKRVVELRLVIKH